MARLAKELVSHAVENADLGPLAFELTTIAAEKASEMQELRLEWVKKTREHTRRAGLRAEQKRKKTEKAALSAVAEFVPAAAAAKEAEKAKKMEGVSKAAQAKMTATTNADLVADMFGDVAGPGVGAGDTSWKKKKKKK